MRSVLRMAVVVWSGVVALCAGELGLRAYDAYVLADSGVGSDPNPLYVLTSEPHRYELRPGVRRYRGRIDINAKGLRGPEISDVRDPGEFRILLVGDSVTFGGEVPYDATFAARVQDRLRQSDDRRFVAARSLNGGVPGYGPYNERYWLREKGPQLHPDAIVIQFCLNDVVDPLPQWDLAVGSTLSSDGISADAIPNAATHHHVLWLRTLRHVRLVTRVESLVTRPATVQGFPAYLTAEQPLSIEVYSNRRSPEIRWLRRTYMDLIAEAKRLTPNVLILVVPLAYQLDPGYPIFSPQEVMAGIARDNDVPSLDLIPALRPLGPVGAFRPGRPGHPDVWHLSAAGHDAAARAIVDTLTRTTASATSSAAQSATPARSLTRMNAVDAATNAPVSAIPQAKR